MDQMLAEQPENFAEQMIQQFIEKIGIEDILQGQELYKLMNEKGLDQLQQLEYVQQAFFSDDNEAITEFIKGLNLIMTKVKLIQQIQVIDLAKQIPTAFFLTIVDKLISFEEERDEELNQKEFLKLFKDNIQISYQLKYQIWDIYIKFIGRPYKPLLEEQKEIPLYQMPTKQQLIEEINKLDQKKQRIKTKLAIEEIADKLLQIVLESTDINIQKQNFHQFCSKNKIIQYDIQIVWDKFQEMLTHSQYSQQQINYQEKGKKKCNQQQQQQQQQEKTQNTEEYLNENKVFFQQSENLQQHEQTDLICQNETQNIQQALRYLEQIQQTEGQKHKQQHEIQNIKQDKEIENRGYNEDTKQCVEEKQLKLAQEEEIKNEDTKQGDVKSNQAFFDDEIQQQKSNDQQQPASIQEYLQQIDKKLNYDKLKEYITFADKNIEKLLKKNIILIIGKTGSGKSTTVHFLYGKKLILKEIEVKRKDSNKTFMDDVIACNENDCLEGFQIGHKSQSETLFINCIKAPNQDEIFMCDTPGYGDTRGLEIEIANQYGVQNSIKQCSSIKFIFLINSSDLKGDRSENFISALKIIINLFNDDFQNHLDSFLILFTHAYDIDSIKKIGKYIYKKLDALKEKENKDVLDQKIIKFLEFLEKGLDNKQVQMLKPTIDNSEEYWNLINKLKNVDQPEQIFNLTLKQDMLQSLEIYIQSLGVLLEQFIINFDFPNLLKILERLQYMDQKLGLAFIKNSYKLYTSKIQILLKEEQKIIYEQVEQVMKDDKDIKCKSFTKQTLFNIQQFQQKLIIICENAQDHFSDKDLQISMFNSYIQVFCEIAQNSVNSNYLVENYFILLQDDLSKIRQLSDLAQISKQFVIYHKNAMEVLIETAEKYNNNLLLRFQQTFNIKEQTQKENNNNICEVNYQLMDNIAFLMKDIAEFIQFEKNLLIIYHQNRVLEKNINFKQKLFEGIEKYLKNITDQVTQQFLDIVDQSKSLFNQKQQYQQQKQSKQQQLSNQDILLDSSNTKSIENISQQQIQKRDEQQKNQSYDQKQEKYSQIEAKNDNFHESKTYQVSAMKENTIQQKLKDLEEQKQNQLQDQQHAEQQIDAQKGNLDKINKEFQQIQEVKARLQEEEEEEEERKQYQQLQNEFLFKQSLKNNSFLINIDFLQFPEQEIQILNIYRQNPIFQQLFATINDYYAKISDFLKKTCDAIINNISSVISIKIPKESLIKVENYSKVEKNIKIFQRLLKMQKLIQENLYELKQQLNNKLKLKFNKYINRIRDILEKINDNKNNNSNQIQQKTLNKLNICLIICQNYKFLDNYFGNLNSAEDEFEFSFEKTINKANRKIKEYVEQLNNQIFQQYEAKDFKATNQSFQSLKNIKSSFQEIEYVNLYDKIFQDLKTKVELKIEDHLKEIKKYEEMLPQLQLQQNTQSVNIQWEKIEITLLEFQDLQNLKLDTMKYDVEKQLQEILSNFQQRLSIMQQQVLNLKTNDDILNIYNGFQIALIQARNDKKLTLEQLASKSQVKESVVEEYELGKAIPGSNTIQQLEEALQVQLPKVNQLDQLVKNLNIIVNIFSDLDNYSNLLKILEGKKNFLYSPKIKSKIQNLFDQLFQEYINLERNQQNPNRMKQIYEILTMFYLNLNDNFQEFSTKYQSLQDFNLIKDETFNKTEKLIDLGEINEILYKQVAFIKDDKDKLSKINQELINKFQLTCDKINSVFTSKRTNIISNVQNIDQNLNQMHYWKVLFQNFNPVQDNNYIDSIQLIENNILQKIEQINKLILEFESKGNYIDFEEEISNLEILFDQLKKYKFLKENLIQRKQNDIDENIQSIKKIDFTKKSDEFLKIILDNLKKEGNNCLSEQNEILNNLQHASQSQKIQTSKYAKQLYETYKQKLVEQIREQTLQKIQNIEQFNIYHIKYQESHSNLMKYRNIKSHFETEFNKIQEDFENENYKNQENIKKFILENLNQNKFDSVQDTLKYNKNQQFISTQFRLSYQNHIKEIFDKYKNYIENQIACEDNLKQTKQQLEIIKENIQKLLANKDFKDNNLAKETNIYYQKQLEEFQTFFIDKFNKNYELIINNLQKIKESLSSKQQHIFSEQIYKDFLFFVNLVQNINDQAIKKKTIEQLQQINDLFNQVLSYFQKFSNFMQDNNKKSADQNQYYKQLNDILNNFQNNEEFLDYVKRNYQQLFNYNKLLDQKNQIFSYIDVKSQVITIIQLIIKDLEDAWEKKNFIQVEDKLNSLQKYETVSSIRNDSSWVDYGQLIQKKKIDIPTNKCIKQFEKLQFDFQLQSDISSLFEAEDYLSQNFGSIYLQQSPKQEINKEFDKTLHNMCFKIKILFQEITDVSNIEYNKIANEVVRIYSIKHYLPIFQNKIDGKISEILSCFIQQVNSLAKNHSNKALWRLGEQLNNLISNEQLLVQIGKEIVCNFSEFNRFALQLFQLRQNNSLTPEDAIKQFQCFQYNRDLKQTEFQYDEIILKYYYKVMSKDQNQNSGSYECYFEKFYKQFYTSSMHSFYQMNSSPSKANLKISQISVQKQQQQTQQQNDWQNIIFGEYQYLLQMKTSNINLENWDNEARESICNILGFVLAVWSFLDLIQNNSSTEQTEKPVYQKPNVVQVLSLLILFRCDTEQKLLDKVKNIFSSENFQNSLIQIKTGEGKSLILGIAATILALLGYNVHVACYSEYLSKRDYSSFQNLFNIFKVQEKILYNSFIQLSELIISKDSDLREMCLSLINNQNKIQQPQQQNKKQKNMILLIDEVDIFFSEDFYANTYNPVAKLKSQDIQQIIKDIWRIKQENTSHKPSDIFKQIQNTQSYKNIMNNYQKIWHGLLNHHIHLMTIDVFRVDSHYYIPTQGKIGYKIHDHTIQFNVSYRYLTIFAYLKEQKFIPQTTVDQYLGISLKCGYFSFSQIQYQYQQILGVTGTLNLLTNVQKQQLIDYKIQKNVYSASIFQQGKLQFFSQQNDHVYIFQTKQDQYLRIQMICNQSQNTAVLIFFKDQNSLNDYYNSKYISKNKLEIDILNENTQYKENVIRKSTMQNQITLLTREFGRGTDFICRDEEVQKNGGVIIIQTFLSKNKSEELQIQGRTARQGQKGQYYLFTCDVDLEKDFQMTKQSINQLRDAGNIYSGLDKIRNNVFENSLLEQKKFIEQLESAHTETQSLIQVLKNQQQKSDEAINLLINFNISQKYTKYAKIEQPRHFIFALDISSSMKTVDQNEKVSRWENLQQALTSFLDLKKNSIVEDYISIIYYSDKAKVQIKAQKLKNVISIIQKDLKPNGNTQFIEAVNLIQDILQNQPSIIQALKKMIVFLTDGEDQSDQELLLTKFKEIKDQYQNQIEAFLGIGFGPQSNNNEGTLKNMVKIMQNDCGGQFKYAQNSEVLISEFQELSNIAPDFI